MQTELHGVLPVKHTAVLKDSVKHSHFEPLQQTAVAWNNSLKQAAAVCNSLTVINKHTVVGADMERSLFKAVEARFLV